MAETYASVSGQLTPGESLERGYFFARSDNPGSALALDAVSVGDELWVVTPIGPRATGWVVSDAAEAASRGEELGITPGTMANMEVQEDGALAHWIVFVRAPGDALAMQIVGSSS